MNPQITPATVAAGFNAAGPNAPGRNAAGSDAARSDAAGPSPAAVTAADAIAEAMAGLSRLENAPTRSHVGAFERVHVALTDALAAIDGV